MTADDETDEDFPEIFSDGLDSSIDEGYERAVPAPMVNGDFTGGVIIDEPRPRLPYRCHRSPPQGDPVTAVYLRNLRKTIKARTLRHVCRRYGPIVAIELSRDGQGLSRGYGYIEYFHAYDAGRAKIAMNGRLVDGQKVSAVLARRKEEQPRPKYAVPRERRGRRRASSPIANCMGDNAKDLAAAGSVANN